jgi:hypothetical protein
MASIAATPSSLPHSSSPMRSAALRCLTCGEVPYLPPSCVKHRGGVRCSGEVRGWKHQTLYTWKPANSIWATIVKCSPCHTAFIFHDDDDYGRAYRATPHWGLAQGCPPGSCFLGQVIFDDPPSAGGGGEDDDDDNDVTHILRPPPSVVVFDILQIGDSMDTTSLPPRERYRLLRDNCGAYFAGTGIGIQWAGDLEPARAFCAAGGGGLPHAVDYMFALSRGHPCHISRV